MLLRPKATLREESRYASHAIALDRWCVTGRTMSTLATRQKIRGFPPLTHPTANGI
ncbi:MAG: hypothetical protein F6K65_02015 [Moorea sp. SIO3C2]|nr:hypothetical protein [Moorena sp. SIO3C2]